MFLQKKSVLDIDAVKEKIDSVEVVSFDIFDTLLLRPYVEPSHLFTHLEQIYHCKGFACNRRAAESRIRQKMKEPEINDVYKELSPNYAIMKSKELQLEQQVLQKNNEIYELYKYAQENNKKIIIISDMYYTQSILTSILNSKGITGFHKLYVSCDYQASKLNKNLYQIVCKDLQVNPKDILHIGDNSISDYKNALLSGLQAYHYIKPISQIFNISCYKKRNTLGLSILLGLMSIAHANFKMVNYFECLGFAYGGPSVYTFMKWLIDEIQDNCNSGNIIDSILFILRDGYSFEQVFNLFNTKIKTNTIYAPRSICRAISLKYNNDLNKLKSLFLYYKKDFNALPEFKTLEEAENFFLANKKKFKALANREQKKYQAYLNNFNITSTTAIVETFSWHFSAQRLLNASTGHDLWGFYWQTTDKSDLLYSAMYEADSRYYSEITNWDLMELLFTSPELPVTGLSDSGEVLHQENPKTEEVYRCSIYPKINKGILAFTNLLFKVFADYTVIIAKEDIKYWLNSFIDNLTDIDKRHLSTISVAEDTMNTKYIPLI